MPEAWKNVLPLGVLVLGIPSGQAFAAAESASPASSSRLVAQAAKATTFALRSPATQSQPPACSAMWTSVSYIVQRNGPPPDEVNRKEFEDRAGEKGGKLLQRSMPSGADVFINDLIVGRTPLRMAAAPGPHKIDMCEARDDSGYAYVPVTPKATLTVAIDLKHSYPSSISIRQKYFGAQVREKI
jgi:hypothetical protein